MGELATIRAGKASPELVRLAGSLERLPRETKVDLIEIFIVQALARVEAKQHCAPYLAALGLLLNRAPAARSSGWIRSRVASPTSCSSSFYATCGRRRQGPTTGLEPQGRPLAAASRSMRGNVTAARAESRQRLS